MKTNQCKSRKRKVRTQQQKCQEQSNNNNMIVNVPKGRVDVVADFIADLWKVMTPEMLNCLQNVLMGDMGISKEETEDIIRNLKEIGNEKSCYEKRYEEKKIVRVGQRNRWIKEVSKTIADQLAMFTVGTLLSTSTDRTKRLSEKILEHLCLLTEEEVTVESANTRIERALVVVADSMAKWINRALTNIEERTKCIYDMKSKPSTPECTVTSVVLSESDDELSESENSLHPFYQYIPVCINSITPDQVYGQPKTWEAEEQITSTGHQIGEITLPIEKPISESEEEEVQEEETDKEENVNLGDEEQDSMSTSEDNEDQDINEDLVEVKQNIEKGSNRNSKITSNHSEVEEDMDKVKIEPTDDENIDTDSFKTAQEEMKEEEKETKNEIGNGEIKVVEKEKVVDENEDSDEVIEVKAEIEIKENESPSVISLKDESLSFNSSSQKDVTDIFDLLKEDMKRLPKDKIESLRHNAVKENVYERFKNIAEENNKTSLDTLMKNEISEAASIAANWIESVLPQADTSPKPSLTPIVRRSSAFEIKQYGSRYKALKLSYNTVAQKVADLRGMGLYERKDKYIPQTMSPMNVKSTNNWADWALGAANVGDDWGRWLDKKVSQIEQRLNDKRPKAAVDRRQSWINWKIKADQEALTWRAENKRIREEGNIWKRKFQRELGRTSEREIKTLSY